MFYEWLEKKAIEAFEKEKVLCKNCNEWETAKVTKEFTTFKCGCGVRIFKPKTPSRDFAIVRFVSKEEYLFNKEQEKKAFENELNGRGINVKRNGTRKTGV